MAHLSLDAKGGQRLADLAEWGRSGAPDNRRQLEQLRQSCEPPAHRFSRPGSGRFWEYIMMRD